jgi:hypothetical protein
LASPCQKFAIYSADVMTPKSANVELDRKMQEIQSLRTVLSTYLVACQDALATGQAQAGRPVLSNIGAQYLPQQAT